MGTWDERSQWCNRLPNAYGEVALMRRILLRVSVTVVMLLLLLAAAVPAFADKPAWCYGLAGCNVSKKVCENSGDYAPPGERCFPKHFSH